MSILKIRLFGAIEIEYDGQPMTGKHVAHAATALPANVVKAAQERGQARNLTATIIELLREVGRG